MCLVLRSSAKRPPKPRIAKKDIEVLKVVEKRDEQFYSPFKGFRWQRGYHYYQEGQAFSFSKDLGGTWHIFQGLHACLTTKKAVTLSFSFWCSKTCIVKMIVPKGAKYYIDRFGSEIVASEMIFPHR